MALRYVPTKHCVQTVAPTVAAGARTLKVPAAHGAQVDVPVVLANVPESHARHRDWPVTDAYTPTAHSVQFAAPVVELIDPAAHG